MGKEKPEELVSRAGALFHSHAHHCAVHGQSLAKITVPESCDLVIAINFIDVTFRL